MTDAPLTLEGVRLGYGATTVLEGVDLEVAAGECVALLGASGSGKTSLLRAVAGFLHPQAGRITLGGRVVYGGERVVPPEERGVGMVFQDYALFAHMTVAQNVAFGVAAHERDERVRHLLELVGLGGLSERRPGELSGGQQQRCALARALAPRPRLLLFDEPFANLDAALRGRLARELRRILHSEQAAALVVTHDCSDAFSLSDRVAVLGSEAPERAPGPTRLLQCASGPEVYRRPRNRAAALLGGPFSLIAGDVRERTLRAPTGEFPVEGLDAGAALAIARPEDLRALPDPAGPFELCEQTYLGRTHVLRLRAGDLELSVESSEPLAEGERYRVEALRPLWAIAAGDP